MAPVDRDPDLLLGVVRIDPGPVPGIDEALIADMSEGEELRRATDQFLREWERAIKRKVLNSSSRRARQAPPGGDYQALF